MLRFKQELVLGKPLRHTAQEVQRALNSGPQSLRWGECRKQWNLVLCFKQVKALRNTLLTGQNTYFIIMLIMSFLTDRTAKGVFC